MQAVGSFSMCIGCWMGIVSMGFLGHIKVMVVTGAVASVGSIQTSGAIWVGRLEVVVLHICTEHFGGYACFALDIWSSYVCWWIS